MYVYICPCRPVIVNLIPYNSFEGNVHDYRIGHRRFPATQIQQHGYRFRTCIPNSDFHHRKSMCLFDSESPCFLINQASPRAHHTEHVSASGFMTQIYVTYSIIRVRVFRPLSFIFRFALPLYHSDALRHLDGSRISFFSPITFQPLNISSLLFCLSLVLLLLPLIIIVIMILLLMILLLLFLLDRTPSPERVDAFLRVLEQAVTIIMIYLLIYTLYYITLYVTINVNIICSYDIL